MCIHLSSRHPRNRVFQIGPENCPFTEDSDENICNARQFSSKKQLIPSTSPAVHSAYTLHSVKAVALPSTPA